MTPKSSLSPWRSLLMFQEQSRTIAGPTGCRRGALTRGARAGGHLAGTVGWNGLPHWTNQTRLPCPHRLDDLQKGQHQRTGQSGVPGGGSTPVSGTRGA